MLLRVLLSIADRRTRERLHGLLRKTDTIVEVLRDRKDLWQRAVAAHADVLLVDQKHAAGPMDPVEEAAADVLDLPAIVAVSGRDSPAEQAELIASGCDAVLYAGLDDNELRNALAAILAKRRAMLDAALIRMPVARPRLSDFMSDSPAMRQFMELVHRVVQSSSSLLILGETGVGKERLARAIHAEGPRGHAPFFAVNCGALPEMLLESELFGHEQGAFTGATRARKGAFELAHGGTLFLDEIGEMPLHLQVKLLRSLQEGEVRPVGGEKSFRADVRIMAASARDLATEAKASRFRQDLYYRLSVVTLTIPPLRDRREDIPILARSYVEFHRPRVGRDVHDISDEAIEALCRYSWPGNVRELVNVIERSILLCRGDTITLADLPAAVAGFVPGAPGQWRLPSRPAEVPGEWLGRTLEDLRSSVVADLERVYLAAMLEATGGKVGEAASRAGLNPRTLYDKMKRYGLTKETFGRDERSGSKGERGRR